MGYIFTDFVFGGSWGDLKRKIEFNNIDRTAKSTPRTTQGIINVEIGTNYCCSGLLFQPFVAAEFGFYNQNKITEKGAASLNLDIKKHCCNTVDTYLGSHITGYWNCFTISADIAWQHCFNDLTGGTHNKFQNFGSSFETCGVRLGNNAIVGALNVSTDLCDTITLYCEVSGEAWSRWGSYNAALGITARW
jgi:uncharacterized protein with beta-barrel porin domain